MQIISKNAEARAFDAIARCKRSEAAILIHFANLYEQEFFRQSHDIIQQIIHESFSDYQVDCYRFGDHDVMLLLHHAPPEILEEFSYKLEFLIGIFLREKTQMQIQDVSALFERFPLAEGGGDLADILERKLLSMMSHGDEEMHNPLELFKSAALQRSVRSKIDVLVAEDRRFYQMLLSSSVPKKNCNLTMVDNGLDALQYYMLTAPDILLIDRQTPKKDGFEVLQRVLEVDPHAHVIIMAHPNFSGDAEQAIELGAASYMIKPFSPRTLQERIENFSHERAIRMGG